MAAPRVSFGEKDMENGGDGAAERYDPACCRRRPDDAESVPGRVRIRQRQSERQQLDNSPAAIDSYDNATN